jgi:hypothetical protein
MRKNLSCLVALLILGCATNPRPAPVQPDGTTRQPGVIVRSGPPLPLDPLTAEEEARARQVAESDGATRELLGTGACPVYVLSIAPKLTPSDDEPRGRHADVLYMRRDQQFGVRALVDLSSGRVVAQDRVAARSVPIGVCDAQQALEVARGSEQLRGLLQTDAGGFRVLTGPLTRDSAQSNYVQALRHTGAGPEDPCSVNRCVYLVFNSGGRMILRDQEVLVDLTARQVRITRAGGGQ